jgi:hypothetical protein
MVSLRTQKKAPRRQSRRRAGSALGLGGKNKRAELMKLGRCAIVPAPRQSGAKKSPAQGGPARGSSAPGLGGKNERAEREKHRGPGIVPQFEVKLRKFGFTSLMEPLARRAQFSK